METRVFLLLGQEVVAMASTCSTATLTLYRNGPGLVLLQVKTRWVIGLSGQPSSPFSESRCRTSSRGSGICQRWILSSQAQIKTSISTVAPHQQRALPALDGVKLERDEIQHQHLFVETLIRIGERRSGMINHRVTELGLHRPPMCQQLKLIRIQQAIMLSTGQV